MQQLENALKAVPQVSLAALPTPFMRMENLEKKLNHAGIFIKRDDLTGLGPGGNKLRSLEFLLGEAMAQSADTVIAAGPPQSNLCTLTAAACARLALRMRREIFCSIVFLALNPIIWAMSARRSARPARSSFHRSLP